MCIIAGRTSSVSKTRILVAPLVSSSNDDEKQPQRQRQLTVYANNVTLSVKQGAMILPFPNKTTTDNTDTTGCRLVDLSGYKTMFDDLSRACFPPKKNKSRSRASNSKDSISGSYIPVERVGSYRASIIPSSLDFDRLQNDVFQVPADVMRFLSEHYPQHEFGFVVCILDQHGEYHPFGYEHNVYDNRMFVPTIHYHQHDDASLTSDWDHDIYVCNAGELNADYNFNGAGNQHQHCTSVAAIAQVQWARFNVPSLCAVTSIHAYRIRRYNRNHDCWPAVSVSV